MRLRSTVTIVLALLCVLVFSSAAIADDGAALFKGRCAPCHGQDGSGNTPMGKKVGAKALGSAEVQKQSDVELKNMVTTGKGKMPAFGHQLSAEQIDQLVKVIRGFAAK